MKKILLSLAIIGIVGGITLGITGAFWTDQGVSANQSFHSGTLDLRLSNSANSGYGDDVINTWSIDKMTPGGAAYESILYMKNKGSVNADYLDFTVQNKPSIVGMDKQMKITKLTYAGEDLLANEVGAVDTGAGMTSYVYTQGYCDAYVSAGCSALGRTFEEDCWHDIQSAVNGVNSNDIVCIENGTYTEQISITKAITLKGESEDGVVVRAHSNIPVQGDNTFTINADGADITIEGMTIRNGDYGIYSSAGNVNVLHVTFVHNGWDGTGISTNPTQTEMASLWANSHTTDGGALRVKGSNGSEFAYVTAYENLRGIRYQDSDSGNIHDCILHDNIESGIYLAAGSYCNTPDDDGCTNTVVKNCESYNNMNNGLLSIGGKNNTLENNYVHDNWNSGVMLWCVGENMVENNDIIHNNLYKFNGVGAVSGDAQGGVWVASGVIKYPGSTFIAKILNNTIRDSQIGGITEKVGVHIGNVASEGITIRNNVFSGHNVDVWVTSQAGTTLVNNNNISANVQNDDATALNAQTNWWGDDNPADQIGGGVNTHNYMTEPYKVSRIPNYNYNGFTDLDDFEHATIRIDDPKLLVNSGNYRALIMGVQLDGPSTGNEFAGGTVGMDMTIIMGQGGN